MSEYIDRKAVAPAIDEQLELSKGDWLFVDRAIANIPPADVAPVVHGRWDCIPNTYVSVASKDGAYSGNATTCSACHEVNPNEYKTNYCPNCGARMDG